MSPSNERELTSATLLYSIGKFNRSDWRLFVRGARGAAADHGTVHENVGGIGDEHVPANCDREVAVVSVKQAQLCLRPADEDDLPFARELTRVNMRDHYARYGLVWQPEAFDGEWPLRENFRVHKAGHLIGYLGFTAEGHYLYLRDVQLVEAYRGEGVGAWIMACVLHMARERGCESVRLKVFKTNPAADLYYRLGFRRVGEEAALLWMEQPVAS